MTWNEKFTHAPNMIGYTATIIEEMIVINKMKTTEWGDSGTGSSQGGGWGETSPLRGLSPRPSGSERFALCDVWSGMDTHLATHTTTLPLLLCGHNPRPSGEYLRSSIYLRFATHTTTSLLLLCEHNPPLALRASTFGRAP